MAQLSYTIGNWAVASHEVDTIANPKTISVADLDYAHDFSVSSASSSSECQLLNTSGTGLEPVEKLRYAKEKVNDIYRNLDVSRASRLPSSVGARVLAEDVNILSCTNSVTGEELVAPIRIWTCIESSTASMITGDALLWALVRHIGQLFKTGLTDSEQIIALFRGDLNPTV